MNARPSLFIRNFNSAPKCHNSADSVVVFQPLTQMTCVSIRSIESTWSYMEANLPLVGRSHSISEHMPLSQQDSHMSWKLNQEADKVSDSRRSSSTIPYLVRLSAR